MSRKITKGQLVGSAALSACSALFIAFVLQAIAPVVAKVPGLVICGGGELELFMRRRTSYAVCAGDPEHIHYGIILLVSTFVWSVLCMPLALVVVRWMARRADGAR